MTDDTTTSEDLRAADGRVPGRRGRQTRDRLLDATAELLQTRGYRELSVVEIARHVGSSPATFYQYFADVESAILVLAQRMVEDGQPMRDAVEQATWTGRAARTSAENLVDAFMKFWTDNGAVMRVVDLAIAEGDQRFREIRNALLGPVTSGLRDGLSALDKVEHDPGAAASVLVSMLAHMAEHQSGLAAWGVGMDAARETMVGIVHWTITGRKPPTD